MFTNMEANMFTNMEANMFTNMEANMGVIMSAISDYVITYMQKSDKKHLPVKVWPLLVMI